MPPRLLILSSYGQTNPIPITEPELWDGQACGVCERPIEHDPVITYSVIKSELRCLRCANAPSPYSADPCIWCGKPNAPLQDTGYRLCQRPCWTSYVAYLADEVEPPDSPFRQLIAQMRESPPPAITPAGETDGPEQAPF